LFVFVVLICFLFSFFAGSVGPTPWTCHLFVCLNIVLLRQSFVKTRRCRQQRHQLLNAQLPTPDDSTDPRIDPNVHAQQSLRYLLLIFFRIY
jgi:hypothetical protein